MELNSDSNIFGLEDQADKVNAQILKRVWNTTPDQMCLAQMVYDDDGTPVDFIILDLNPAFEKAYGFARDQAINKRVTELFPYYDPRWIEKCGEAVRSGKSLISVEHITEPYLWYEVQVFPLGSGGQFISMAQDITERKKLEGELFAHSVEDKCRMLLNSIDQGYFLIDVIFDENDRPIDMYYVEANEAATKILGSDYTGKRLREINPNYEENWFEIFGNVALTGQGARLEQYAEPDKKWYNFNIFKIGDENSRRIGNIFMDITESKRAADALKASEGLFQTLFENTEDGFALVQPIFDESGFSDKYLMVNANQAWAKQTGLKADDFIGKTIKESMPGVESSWPEAYANVTKSGESMHFESFNHISNRWYDIYAFNYQEGLVGVLFRDISERKEIEKARQESEKRKTFLLKLSDALRSLDDPIKMQNAAVRLLGEQLGANQVHFGETVGDDVIIRQGYGNGLPPMTGRFRFMDLGERLVAACRAGKTAVCCNVDTDPAITKDEAIVFTSLGFRAYIAVPLIKDGQWVVALAVHSIEPRSWTMEEVALVEEAAERTWAAVEQAGAEEALRKSQAQLKVELEDTKLLQSISAELLNEDNTLDLYEKIIDAAASIMQSDFASLQIFYPERGSDGQLKLLIHRGFNPQAAEFWEWVDASDGSSCGAALRTGQRTIVPNVNECDFMKGTEDLEIFQQTGINAVQTTPLISRGGNLLGMFSTHWRYPHHPSERKLLVLDVLARQAAEIIERRLAEEALRKSEQLALELVEKLRQADQNKNTFINMLSHELRNPLASIMMSLELLNIGPADGKDAAMALEIAERQGQQLAHLVDDLLDVTRMTQNKVALKKESVELNEIIKKAILDYQSHFVEKTVRLEVNLTSPLYVEADPSRLTQVIDNLLHNAAKFTSNGDIVTITVSQDANTSEAVITVQDTGRGIEPEYLGDLYEPFTQVDASLDRSHGGLGLGLAIVKGMVELHDGRVEVFSEGRDKGAKFTIRLPLPKGDIKEQERYEKLDPSSNESLTILIIDDNEGLAGLICKIIDIVGHKATAAYNGIAGIAKARELRPEVIICDIGLPGMNGYEVAQLIRKDPELQDTLLIALSGYAQPEDVELSKEAGFDRHLGKPVSINTLQQVLNDVIRERI